MRTTARSEREPRSQSTIAEEAMFDLDAPIVRIGGPDIPAMPFAGALEHYYVEPKPDHLYRGMLDLARS